MRIFTLCLFTSYFVSCTVIIPPITLTGSKTAIEKQIIGEDNEIEEDVWLISSVKTVQGKKEQELSSKKAKDSKKNSLTYKAIAILDVFEPYLSKLKKDLVVGEDQNGFVSNLFLEKKVNPPKEAYKKYDAKLAQDPEKGRPYRMLIETVKQVNKARNMLVKGYIIHQKNKNRDYKPNRISLLQEMRLKYQSLTLPGRYIQKSNGVWERK